jgi:hypothetical protein
MTPVDILWLVLWFVVGLCVFQIRGIKSIMGEISDSYSILGVIPLILGVLYGTYTLPNVFVGYIGGVMMGVLSSLAYLIGAIISRYRQFGEMSPRILAYSALFIMFWIVFEALF